MKNSFIDQVVKATLSLNALSSLVVFPTRRACQYYMHRYAENIQRASLLPQTIAIAELVEVAGGRQVADELQLLIILHDVHVKLFGPSDFDSFFGYGQQLLKDFNESDRQLIDVNLLFSEVSNLKEIEERFSSDEEVRGLLTSFWSGMKESADSSLKTSFLTYWKQLPLLYKTFREVLQERNLAYEGMAWRDFAEHIDSFSWLNRWDQVVVAGFYALNRSEEVVFDFWKSKKVLQLYVDADPFYTDNPFHEAGLFFRKGYFKDETVPWRMNYLNTPCKDYLVTGCAGPENLVRELVLSIHRFRMEHSDILLSDIVVVLADESLLQAFLVYASLWNLPVNPSMGFPLSSHPFLHLVKKMRDFRRIDASDHTPFSRERLLKDLLDQPLVQRMLSADERKRLEEDFSFQGNSLPEKFAGAINPDMESDKFLLLEALDLCSRDSSGWWADLDRNLIAQLHKSFSVLSPFEGVLSLAMWWKLLLHHLQSARATFQSPDSDAIPVMGFLETRNMDYKAVFIAPLNEGVLPSRSITKSLIPYSVRKAFGLPNKEEQDAVTAYHFYRLLQRASSVFLFYNTDLDAMGGGERSRYLFQLQHEKVEKYPPENFSYTTVTSDLHVSPEHKITIDKTPSIIEVLERKLGIGAAPSSFTGLSASALNTYIACSLRFYFDHVADIRPDEDEVGLLAGNFGNVLHKTMELMYQGCRTVNADLIQSRLSTISEWTDKAVADVYREGALSGHDQLMKGVIEELVRRILLHDLEQVPLNLSALEGRFSISLPLSQNRNVVFKGIIDRLQEDKNGLNILDYKTGKELPKKESTSDLIFSNPDYKINLQLLLYTLLVSRQEEFKGKTLRAGLFRMREFDEGITWLHQGKEIDAETIQDFEAGLIRLAEQILNPQTAFRQTEDVKQCRYCDYRNLCRKF